MRKHPGRLGVIAAVVAAIAVVLWGGYGHHWPWTGISGRTATLWDWLHLLLLPIAFGLLPILLSRRTRMRREHKLLSVAAIVVLFVIVIAGYVVPWSWTGFEGNRVWDWLELLALPLAIAVIPVMPDLRNSWDSRHSIVAVAALAAFVAIVIGGYVGNWSWTGFRGNTLWDWLHLMLLPLLLPTVIVPALVPAASSRMLPVEVREPSPHEAIASPHEGIRPARPPDPTATHGNPTRPA